MKLPRWMSLFDFAGIVTVLAVAALSARPHTATLGVVPAFATKDSPEEVRWRLGVAQARAALAERDGHRDAAVDVALVNALTYASFGDWSVEQAHSALRRSERTPEAAGQWRLAFSISEAHADRLEASPALAWAKYALTLCAADIERARDAITEATPALAAGSVPGATPAIASAAPLARPEVCDVAWQARLTEYVRAFEAGVASGIDPRRDPNGFREAGERALRMLQAE